MIKNSLTITDHLIGKTALVTGASSGIACVCGPTVLSLQW